jgi:hypothetical protein
MPTIEVKPKVFITNSFLQPIPFYNHFQHEGVLLCFGNKCEDSKPLNNKIHSLAWYIPTKRFSQFGTASL